MTSSSDLAALYKRHRQSMFNMAAFTLHGVGRGHEAMDVVQDVMVSLLKSFPKGVENWEAFLVTATKRKALDRIKSAQVQHAGPPIDQTGAEKWLMDDALSVELQVLERFHNEDLSVLLRECMQVLDERHRRVLWEIQVRCRTRADVANELGVSPARISQMTTKALAQMREELQKREGVDQWRNTHAKSS